MVPVHFSLRPTTKWHFDQQYQDYISMPINQTHLCAILYQKQNFFTLWYLDVVTLVSLLFWPMCRLSVFSNFADLEISNTFSIFKKCQKCNSKLKVYIYWTIINDSFQTIKILKIFLLENNQNLAPCNNFQWLIQQ